nr:PAS domain-containing protein [uncultured Dongia sp.]
MPASLRSVRLRAFHEYWLGLANGDVPARGDIDPVMIKPLLPYMMMVDLTEEPMRVLYRLVGTEVVSFTGLEFTGHYLDELDFDEFDLGNLTDAYRAVRDARLPGAGLAQYRENGLLLIETEYLICPLRSGSGKIDKCAAIEDYFLGGTSVFHLPPARFRRS